MEETSVDFPLYDVFMVMCGYVTRINISYAFISYISSPITIYFTSFHLWEKNPICKVSLHVFTHLIYLSFAMISFGERKRLVQLCILLLQTHFLQHYMVWSDVWLSKFFDYMRLSLALIIIIEMMPTQRDSSCIALVGSKRKGFSYSA